MNPNPETFHQVAIPTLDTDLTVYYDGVCPLCRREIEFLKRLDTGDGVAWVNLCERPDGLVTPGLSKPDALKVFHVKTADGRLLSGAAAFLQLWGRSPRMTAVTRVLSNRPTLFLLNIAYRGFLLVRPVLQRLVRRWDRENRVAP
ncbi:MAG: DUF393 domain-containing protein [Proteobacteria bacterium]|nr:DUF393 domain-containing protein [Pseudomonadota bacterium]